jgi:hypothetical protein
LIAPSETPDLLKFVPIPLPDELVIATVIAGEEGRIGQAEARDVAGTITWGAEMWWREGERFNGTRLREELFGVDEL